MKNTFLILAASILFTNGAAQTDSKITNFLKSESGGIEIFELAFCADELKAILDNDTSFTSTIKKRLGRRFDPRLSESIRTVHQLELVFLKNVSPALNASPQFKNAISHFDHDKRINAISEYTRLFKAYIEYPEMVDNAFIILLLISTNENLWVSIEQDKTLHFHFNNWIRYGFEEFRYFPGTKSQAQEVLNTRIVSFLRQKYINSKNPMIIRALEMFRTVEDKYKSKK
jgi:hypothetical protein